MDKEIYFVRHGETDYNRLKIVQGSGVDSDLNELGKQQAQLFYLAYNNVEFDLVITSALRRTHQTVQNFLDNSLPHVMDERINEINWGVHEGKESTDEMITAYRNLIEAWSRDELDESLEEGESAKELLNRVNSFLSDLKSRSEKRILVCSHGRTLRCLMAAINQEPMSQMEKYQHANTGLFKVNLTNDVWSVETLNKIDHLETLSNSSSYEA